MKTLIRIAWRNLWRNRRRSIVVITSIGFGIFAMIISIGFMNGMMVQTVENTISTSLGHIAIHKKGYQEAMKLEYHFNPSERALHSVEKNPAVKAWAPRLMAQGMLRSSESARGVMMVGIDPAREKKVTKIYDYMLRDGVSRYLDGPDDDSIIISKSVADRLDLMVGDKLVLMMQDKNNEIIGVGMTVKGFFRTPVESFDKFVAFTGIRKLQEISGMGANITEINMILPDKGNVDSVKAGIVRALNDPGLEVLSWKDMAPNLVSAIKLFDSMMYIFFAIVFITVIFSVANTLIMAIMERFHEIGVMKSIGTRPSWIFTMIMIEAVNLGMVGLAAGIIAGLALVVITGVTGIDFSFYMESFRMFGTGNIIYPTIKAMHIVMSTVIVLMTTILAALYPAVKAARIKPLEALNYI
jgi:ABC-type lipoprotein release transport system permease subunit